MYGRVTIEDIQDILDAIENGTVVERLSINPEF